MMKLNTTSYCIIILKSTIRLPAQRINSNVLILTGTILQLKLSGGRCNGATQHFMHRTYKFGQQKTVGHCCCWGLRVMNLFNASMNEAFYMLMKPVPEWASWYDTLEKRRRVITWIRAS